MKMCKHVKQTQFSVVQVLFGLTQGDSKTCCLYLPDLDTVNP